MKLLTIVALSALSISAQAADVEIGIGQTTFRAREDGTWWQSQYETHNDLKSRSWRVAVRDHFRGSSRFGWSVGYSDLGRFSGNNHASIWDSEAGKISEDDSQCQPSNFSHGCMAWFRGAGKAKGITFGLTADHKLGPVVVGVEGGLFVFRSSYDVTITYPNGLMPAGVLPDGTVTSNPDVPAVPAGGSADYHRATGTHRTPYYGVRLGYGYLYAQALVFHNVYEQGNYSGGDVGLTGGRTVQVTAGIAISF